MRFRHSVHWAAALVLCMMTLSHAGQEPIGVSVPPLGEGPWVIDTAEQHSIRVSVVTKGLSHPWAIAFLPGGDMLITERDGRLRVVRDPPRSGRGIAEMLGTREDRNVAE